MLFTVVVHFATALSTLVVFRRQVFGIIAGLFESGNKESWSFSGKIILSMIPAAMIGVLFADELERLFDRQVLLVGAMLLVTGFLLIAADRPSGQGRSVTMLDAMIVGLAQAFAILPGISRSGATISCSVLLGIRRQDAAEFSFLMVVPLILGKIAKDLLDGALYLSPDQLGVLLAGFVAAFVSGLLACQWMVTLVRNAQLKYFAYYCFTVGALRSPTISSSWQRSRSFTFGPPRRPETRTLRFSSHPSGRFGLLLEASTERYSHIEGWRDSHMKRAVRTWKVKIIS